MLFYLGLLIDLVIKLFKIAYFRLSKESSHSREESSDPQSKDGGRVEQTTRGRALHAVSPFPLIVWATRIYREHWVSLTVKASNSHVHYPFNIVHPLFIFVLINLIAILIDPYLSSGKDSIEIFLVPVSFCAVPHRPIKDVHLKGGKVNNCIVKRSFQVFMNDIVNVKPSPSEKPLRVSDGEFKHH